LVQRLRREKPWIRVQVVPGAAVIRRPQVLRYCDPARRQLNRNLLKVYSLRRGRDIRAIARADLADSVASITGLAKERSDPGSFAEFPIIGD
jgi:hypothetical protein